MDDPEPSVLDLDDPSLRQELSQRRLVHVPDHGLDRRKPSELFEHGDGNEVACVQDQVCSLEPTQTLRRQPPRPSREMRIRDDGDQRQLLAPSRKTPSR
jgi:hypothetical protein